MCPSLGQKFTLSKLNFYLHVPSKTFALKIRFQRVSVKFRGENIPNGTTAIYSQCLKVAKVFFPNFANLTQISSSSLAYFPNYHSSIVHFLKQISKLPSPSLFLFWSYFSHFKSDFHGVKSKVSLLY